MRVGIDAHPIGRRQTGNERVMRNLCRALARVSDHEFVLYFSDRDSAVEWRAEPRDGTVAKVSPLANRFVRVPVLLPLMAARDEVDVLLCHMNSPPFRRCPMVTLVHDVSFARHPEYFAPSERFLMNRYTPASMRWSDAVVTVSDFTRSEVIDVYGIPEEKVFVAHNSVESGFAALPFVQPERTRPYFLAVGNLQPRKNLMTLLRAFRLLLKTQPHVREDLLIVGQKQYKDGEILGEAADLIASGRVAFTGYLDDRDLIGHLRGATGLAYPSVYEGFGLPPLEAMALGTPALVADIPVMREVVGDAAMRIPATDVGAWAAALGRLAGDQGLRRRLTEKGLARCGQFTWDESARNVLRAIEYALERRKKGHQIGSAHG